MKKDLPLSITHEVRDRCLCLHLQRAARAVARRFDEVFRALELTNGQFSLLMSLNRPEPPSVGEVAHVLAMDRTTLTAALKPLERRGLLVSKADPRDKRSRRLFLTDDGRDLLTQALPIWRDTHDELDRVAASVDISALTEQLYGLTFGGEDDSASDD